MERLEKFREEYWTIYTSDLQGQSFIWRGITRKEFTKIARSDVDSMTQEEEICRLCTIEPRDYNFEDCLAGVPTLLAGHILNESGYGTSDGTKLKQIMATNRQEMEDFQNQVSCIIHEGFPMLDIEEIDNWSMEKTLWYFSRAEYKLSLRGIDLVNVEGEEPTQQNIMAPPSGGASKNYADFPELKMEKQFMEGKFR